MISTFPIFTRADHELINSLMEMQLGCLPIVAKHPCGLTNNLFTKTWINDLYLSDIDLGFRGSVEAT